MQGGNAKTILAIDDTPVTTEEFLYVYNKNNLNNAPKSREEIDDYLDLFINFKLKVKEAEALGLDRDSAFIQELEGYKKQLAAPYLTETKLLDSLAKVTYERLKTEVSASHILIKVPEDAEPEDTLAAYQQTMSLRDRILGGEGDFGQVAQSQSEDPSAKQNRGNLGYFTAMQMVYPFEDAAYKLPVDSISQPVRTSFGYHIIQVNDRRPSQGKVQVSHILVRAQDGMSLQDSTLAAERAKEIYARARNNEDWDLLCRQFSEDLGTKMKGGALPWFKTGDISNIPSFEKAAFELKDIGEIHKPVKTAYGWHIIRLDNKQGIESFEEVEQKIRSSLTANSRNKLNQQELVKRLKKENHFKEHKEIVDKALEFANETLNKGTWKSQDHWDVQGEELFRIQKSAYLVSEFFQYVEEKQPLKYQSDPKEMMKLAYQDFIKERLINYEEAHLGEKYYDYKMLAKEYRDGILLFQLMETKVWNRAIEDSVGLKNYFNKHRDQYQWEKRVSATIFNTIDEQALNEVLRFLEKGYFNYGKYDFYGSSNKFNNAQQKILTNLSQSLVQHNERDLVMEFDIASLENMTTYQAISELLGQYQIDSSRVSIQALPKNTQEFVVYVVSSSLKDLEENMNQENPLTIKVESGLYQMEENQAVDQVTWEIGTNTVEIDDRLVLVEIKKVIPQSQQELNEIKGQVISDYQTHLESLWIDELRSKYQVDVHEKELEKVYRQYDF
jgi:peptidyl-prolyl cis-trans isomerase SurA